ncbi:putative ribonuclease H-like domain-containing protein [Tanacetum coccineum]
MIGSLMCLTSSTPDIMFAVYSPFDLVAYNDSDYARASLDRKSTIGGYQFLWCRLISWQCKKQTVVANSTTEAEYIAASNCYRQNWSNTGDSKFNAARHKLIAAWFWDTVKAKTVNGEVQLQALVDKKKLTLMGVLDLETTNTAKAKEIASLKKRVKKLKRKRKSKTSRMKRLFKIGVLDEQEVEVKKIVSTAEVTTKSATTTTIDELTLTQTLIEIKAAKPKVRGVMIQEPSEFTTTTTTITPAASKPS